MNKLELVIFNMRIEGVGFYGQTLAALIGIVLAARLCVSTGRVSGKAGHAARFQVRRIDVGKVRGTCRPGTYGAAIR